MILEEFENSCGVIGLDGVNADIETEFVTGIGIEGAEDVDPNFDLVFVGGVDLIFRPAMDAAVHGLGVK